MLNESFIAGQIEYSHSLREMAKEVDSPVELIDTTHDSVESTIEQVAQWIRKQVRLQ